MKKEKWDNLKRADDAYVAEQTPDQKKYVELIEIERESVVFSDRELTVESYRKIALRESPWKENIMEYTTLSFELGRLYAAIGLDRLCRAAIARGLSIMDSETIKRNAITEIATADTYEEMQGVTSRAAVRYNQLYRSSLDGQYSYLIVRADEQIRQNRMKKLTTKDVAEALDVNASYLSKRFKQETGHTITETILNTKMETAMLLLSNHMYSLHEVSDLLGFEDYSYFSKCFKKHQGCTPSQYMKNYQKQ